MIRPASARSVSAPEGAAAAASLDPEAGSVRSSSSTARSLFVVNVLDRDADGGGGGEDALPPMWRGRLALDANPLLSPPPPLVEKDPVGADLRAIPAVLSRLNADFDTEQPSPNRVAAWTLTSRCGCTATAHTMAQSTSWSPDAR